jgi:hypothetical protein
MQTRIVAKQALTGRWLFWPQYKKWFMWWNFKGKHGGKVFLMRKKEARDWIRSKSTKVAGNIHTVLVD